MQFYESNLISHFFKFIFFLFWILFDGFDIPIAYKLIGRDDLAIQNQLPGFGQIQPQNEEQSNLEQKPNVTEGFAKSRESQWPNK